MQFLLTQKQWDPSEQPCTSSLSPQCLQVFGEGMMRAAHGHDTGKSGISVPSLAHSLIFNWVVFCTTTEPVLMF